MPRPKNSSAYGGAPRWLLTMGDMNNLLLCFFIALFALMSFEKPRYRQGEATVPQGQPIKSESVQQVIQVLRQAMEDKTSFTSQLQIEGTNTEITKTPDGVRLTIGAEFDPFDEGSYKLKETHYKILDILILWMVEYKNTIEIRGYTGVNPEDSLVVELDNIRKWKDEDRARAENGEVFPDHRLLSFYRAQEVAKYLSKPVTEEKRIDPSRLVIVSEGEFGTRRAPNPFWLKPGEKVKTVPGKIGEPNPKWRENQKFDRRVDVMVLTSRP